MIKPVCTFHSKVGNKPLPTHLGNKYKFFFNMGLDLNDFSFSKKKNQIKKKKEEENSSLMPIQAKSRSNHKPKSES